MTKSSRTRKAKFRAKKRFSTEATQFGTDSNIDRETGLPELSPVDKRYLIAFAVLSAAITVVYWWMGGRTLFVFPALLCISVGARKYWKGPVSRYAEHG